jgi:putative endonuclease
MGSSERSPAGPRGRTGASAETAVAEHRVSEGWVIVARNVRLGRDELDLVVCPPPPEHDRLVIVEVRSRSAPGYGTAVESVDGRKVARLYRAAAVLVRVGHASVPSELLRHPPRVDLVCVRRARGAWVIERHLRGLAPP